MAFFPSQLRLSLAALNNLLLPHLLSVFAVCPGQGAEPGPGGAGGAGCELSLHLFLSFYYFLHGVGVCMCVLSECV